MAKKTIAVEDLESGPIPNVAIPMIGGTFGLFTVTGYAGKWRQMPYLHCGCACGKQTIVQAYHLRNGKSKSCGCATGQFVTVGKTQHGYAPLNTKQPRVYMTWKGIRRRCNNPNDSHYKHYGGRGIRVCERWSSFVNFLADMGEPAPGMSIERKDNDKDYGPDNCIWIPHVDQSKNRRHNWTIDFHGDRVTIAEAARRIGMDKTTLRERIIRNGYTKREVVKIKNGIFPQILGHFGL